MNRKLNIPDDVEELAHKTVNAVFHLHNEMGPGLLESVYATCLTEELTYRGISSICEMPVPLSYRNRRLDMGFRVDCMVEGKLLLELKATESVLPVHRAQVITYLKLTKLPLGLLINFNVPLIKDGIHRVFNPNLT
ncbi:MAG TPA: GxxExxY protein [Lacunisphaera sp.]